MPYYLLTLALFFSAGAGFAEQAPGTTQAPSENSQVFTSDLVAWTFMQQPQTPEHRPSQQPVPEPAPETQPPQNPTPSQPSSPPSAQSPSQSQSEPPAAETFMGTVSKDSDSFVLRVSASTSYKLDNPEQVQQYLGQRVRVTGTLERAINLIHVDRIEPIS